MNEEVRDLFAAGADVVQLDEPWLQARPEAAERYGVKAINRALEGVRGTDRRCTCASATRRSCTDKPERLFASCRSSRTSTAEQISIEAAQPKLDLGVLARPVAARRSCSACSTSATRRSRPPRQVAARIRAGLATCRAGRGWSLAPDCGMKYLPRDAAFGKLKALAEGAAIVRRELS